MNNKRKGYNAEVKLKDLFTKWDLKCWRIPGSGAWKNRGEDLDSDLRVVIYDEARKVEVKRRGQFKRFYNLTNGKTVIIEGFCVLVPQDTLYGMLEAGQKPGVVVTIPDKQFKVLHSYFEQDNADMVAMVSPYKPFVFALSLPLWKELYYNCYGVAC